MQGSDGIRRRLWCGGFVGCNEGLELGHRLWGGIWECLGVKGLRVLSRAAIEGDGNMPFRFNGKFIRCFFFSALYQVQEEVVKR